MPKGQHATALVALLVLAPLLAATGSTLASPVDKSGDESYPGTSGEPIPTSYYPIDGHGVNAANPEWNAQNSDLGRKVPSMAENGSGLAFPDLPSPRTISNAVCSQQQGLVPDETGLSDYNWLWGQFITHEVDFTLTQNGRVSGIPETANIPVEAHDPHFGAPAGGAALIPFFRSLYNSSTGEDSSDPRQHPNSVTGWIDGSVIYGSKDSVASWLRTGESGRLKVSEDAYGHLLPIAADDDDTAPGMSFVGFSADVRYIAGDSRANEHASLMAIHVLFVREHNRLAEEIQERNPDWNDEQVFQRTRKIVTALIQVVNYEEFLPSLGITLPNYTGYDEAIDPTVTNSFATVAFRMGHSQIGPMVMRLEENRTPIPQGHVLMKDAFWKTSVVTEGGGIGPLLRGLAFTTQEANDIYFHDDLRNTLFGMPGAGGADLCAIDIQRGRDHGVADYNSLREVIGLPKVGNWSDVTSDAEVESRLSSVYSDLDRVDGLMGMLAEDHLNGSVLGPTMHALIKDQFLRLRDGDPLFYLNDPELTDIATNLTGTTLAEIILRNTEIEAIQCNVFFAETNGSRFDCNNANLETPPSYAVDGSTDSNPVVAEFGFTDVTASSGLYEVDSGPLTDWAAYGPSIAWGDCDGDRDQDVFIGARFDHLGWESGGTTTGLNHLMINDGDSTFSDGTTASGIAADNSTTLGATWADYDDDGDLDLYLSNYGVADFGDDYATSGAANQLYENAGDCTFTDVTESTGVGNHGHSSGSVWVDFDHDGDLDLYSLNIGMIDENNTVIRSATNILYRNQLTESGSPTFIDWTDEAGGLYGQPERANSDNDIKYGELESIAPTAPPSPSATAVVKEYLGQEGKGTGVSWAAIWFDYDGDGWEDLYVASDFGISPLYRNDRDGTFTLVTFEADMKEPGTGMGVHAADVDGDGDLDLCQSNFGPNFLWRNDGDGTFTQDGVNSGIHENVLVNWDCHFYDIDLDRDADLWFGVGRINPFTSFNNNSLYLNDGNGQFTDVIEQVGLAGQHKTMGAAWADFDGDGDLDLLMGNSNGPLNLFRNDAVESGSGDWLKVDLEGLGIAGGGSNRNGVGAMVTVRMADGDTMKQMAYAGSGFLGTSEPHVHFGLGNDSRIDYVAVLWSTGHLQIIEDVSANTVLTVNEELPPQRNNAVTGFLLGILLLSLVALLWPAIKAARAS